MFTKIKSYDDLIKKPWRFILMLLRKARQVHQVRQAWSDPDRQVNTAGKGSPSAPSAPIMIQPDRSFLHPQILDAPTIADRMASHIRRSLRSTQLPILDDPTTAWLDDPYNRWAWWSGSTPIGLAVVDASLI